METKGLFGAMTPEPRSERRKAMVLLGAVALVGPSLLIAQQQKLRIGYLANDPDRASPTFQAFARALNELGWVEGSNVEILYLSSGGRDELFAGIAANAVRSSVDLIVTTGSASTKAAIAATDRIPIVFGSAANPVEQKFVASLSRPGGNVTGLALLVQELGPKRLQLMKELLPHGYHFARLYQSASIAPLQPGIISEDDAAAKTLGVRLQHVPVKSIDGIEPAFAAAARDKIDGIITTAAALFVVNREWLARLAIQYKLPMMCADARFCEAGALISYGENFSSRYRRAAFLVDKILRGAKPADLPVEQPTVFELVLNLRTANALGMSIPASVVLQADRLVK
jgi:putative ABC transport system substrate-binding protein